MIEIKKLGDKNLKATFVNLKYAQGYKENMKKIRKEMINMIKNQRKL